MFLDRNPDNIRSLLRSVRPLTKRPLLVKLTPNVDDILVVAGAAMEGGADILSVANTYIGLALDWRARKPMVAAGTGGLSGPAIKPMSLRLVWQVASTLKVPVVGIGGVASAQDALEYMVAGAGAVQVGTANFVDPTVCVGIVEEMPRLLEEVGIRNVRDIVGTLEMPARRPG